MTDPLREEAAPAANELSSAVPRPTHFLLLLVLPALLIFVACSIRTTSGPYWYSENLDPSYAYLMNSLNIANLHRPNHIDHPGTPVQTIGAIVIKAKNLGANESSLARTVLQNPDIYLRLINNLFIFLASVCLLGGGYVVFRITGDLFSAIVLQSTPFLSATTMQGLYGVRPEPLFVSLSILFSVLILLTLKFETRKHALKFSLAFGFLAGLGMAAKINFLPLLLIPLILLSSWKWRAVYVLTTGMAFLFFILPILAPGHLMRFFGFAVAISTHTGRYGTGAAGIVSPGDFARNAVNLMRTDWLFFLIMAAGAVLLITKSGRARLKGARYKILLAVTLTQFLQFLIVAKHPSSHYLIPAMGLMGVDLIVVFDAWRETSVTNRMRWTVLAIICAGFGTVAILSLIKQHDELRTLATRQRGAYQITQNEFRGRRVVDYYSASSEPYALKFGVEYSGNLYVSTLQELYPGSLFYNPWTQQFSNFVGPVELSKIAAPGDWFVMRGYSLNDSDFRKFLPPNAFPENLKLEAVYRGDTDIPAVYDGEAIYRATIKTER
jgi:hypothetical protein